MRKEKYPREPTSRAGPYITLLSIIGLENKKLRPTEAGMFYGIVIGLAIGLPVYLTGAFGSFAAGKWLGTLLTVSIPGLLAYLSSDNGYKRIFRG